jgi:hypothetical protein
MFRKYLFDMMDKNIFDHFHDILANVPLNCRFSSTGNISDIWRSDGPHWNLFRQFKFFPYLNYTQHFRHSDSPWLSISGILTHHDSAFQALLNRNPALFNSFIKKTLSKLYNFIKFYAIFRSKMTISPERQIGQVTPNFGWHTNVWSIYE